MNRLAPRLSAFFALASCWLLATALNLTKAVHVDDAAYLEMARHIRGHPLHPFSGTLSWAAHSEPIYHTNQPPLLFYQHAAVIAVFGEREVPLHAVTSLWTLAAVVFFYQLARRAGCEHVILLTAMFCLGPAFLPSQNLMTDVPTVALWLIFFWALCADGGERPGTRRFVIAAVACAAACLTKYVSLVLLPILVLAAVLDRSPRAAATVIIPIFALLAWSLFNVFDYGGVHLLGRGSSSLHASVIPRRLAEWGLCLGAVSPFTVMFVPRLRANRWTFSLPAVCAVVAAAVFVASRSVWQNLPLESALKAAFAANGVFLLAVTGAFLLKDLFRPEADGSGTPPRNTVIFAAWLLGATGVVVAFSPGMAVRHSLCVVPVLLLIGGGGGRRAGGGWVATAAALTAVCGTWFGASDWVYADVYRQESRRLYQQFSREGQTLWHVGHWGWQWYADQAGMQQYDLRTSQPIAGDRIVVPRLVDKQPLAARHQRQLKLVGQSDVAAPPVTWVRMMAIGPRGGYGYYAFRIETLPWTFSTGPLEHFDVFEWQGPATGEGSSRLEDGRSNGFRATR